MENEKFVIDTLDKANWAMMKIKENDNEMEIRRAQYDEMIKRADKWLETECREFTQHNAYLKSLLQDFTAAELTRRNEGKKKQVKYLNLPYGKAGFKKVQAELSCGGFKCAANNQNLVGVLNKMGLTEYITKTTMDKVAWNDLKADLIVDDNGSVVYAPTGEVMEGITVTRPAGIEFNVKVE